MQTVLITHEGPVARIALNRPAARNAFDAQAVAELTQAFAELAPSVRVVVLTGTGDVFCAGADLHWMQQSAAYSQVENRADAQRLAALFHTIDSAPQAVIGRINGLAMGGGVGLTACCDMVVAVDTARFAFSEARLGIVPAVIAPYVLRKIGVGQARRHFLTAALFSAQEAYHMGLIHQIAPVAQLDSVVQEWTTAVLRCGPVAVHEAKKLIATLDVLPEPEAAAYAADTIARLRVSPEGQEGLTAFLQKRAPSWT